MLNFFKKELSKIFTAFSFLSILPISFRDDMPGLSAYFPLVGWLLGFLLIILNKFLFFLPALVRSFIIVLFWELFSRFLHLDALADAADAFIRGGKKEELLKIMADSKIGAFGVSAIIFLLIGKITLISSLNYKDSHLAFLAAALFSRYLLTVISFIFPAAKSSGLGWLMASTTGFKELLIATFCILPAVFVFKSTFFISFAGLLFPLPIAAFMVKKVGGLTGDILGATLELSELFVLFFFLF